MPMNEEVLDVLDRCDADSGLSLIYMERRDYATIRAELHRLTDRLEAADAEIARLRIVVGETAQMAEDVDYRLAAADALLRDARGMFSPKPYTGNYEAIALIGRIQSHLKGAGDE